MAEYQRLIENLKAELQALKEENEKLNQELANIPAQTPGTENESEAFKNLSPQAKKELQEIDFNLAKLEKVKLMYEKKLITREEFRELKEKIFNRL